jgi:hypothetical protein
VEKFSSVDNQVGGVRPPNLGLYTGLHHADAIDYDQIRATNPLKHLGGGRVDA